MNEFSIFDASILLYFFWGKRNMLSYSTMIKFMYNVAVLYFIVEYVAILVIN